MKVTAVSIEKTILNECLASLRKKKYYDTCFMMIHAICQQPFLGLHNEVVVCCDVALQQEQHQFDPHRYPGSHPTV